MSSKKEHVKNVSFDNQGYVVIWNFPYRGCTNLATIEMPDKSKTFGISKLANTAISSLEIKYCEIIYESAFANMPNLQSVKIGKLVQYASRMFITLEQLLHLTSILPHHICFSHILQQMEHEQHLIRTSLFMSLAVIHPTPHL